MEANVIIYIGVYSPGYKIMPLKDFSKFNAMHTDISDVVHIIYECRNINKHNVLIYCERYSRVLLEVYFISYYYIANMDFPFIVIILLSQ